MEKEPQQPLDLATVRARLAASKGKHYWRSLEELADTDDFRSFLEDEFPQQARTWGIHIDRRQFLYLMGASLGLAGMSGCRFLPQEKTVPYVKQPEEIVLGLPLFFASAFTFNGAATGVLVESHEGRPTKIEGNELHPGSLGSTDAFTQASVLTLYDPDRAHTVLHQGQIGTQDAFLGAARAAIAKQRETKGAGLRLLTEAILSPTLAAQLQALLTEFPGAKWHQYESVGRDNARAAATLAFGEDVNTVYHFEKANVVLALDADIFAGLPGSIRYARDFASRRRVRSEDISPQQPKQEEMNRLYSVESSPTLTGAMADHNQPLLPAEIENFAFALAQKLGVNVGAAPANVPASVAKWLDPLARDLQKAGSQALVVAGTQQSPTVHALAHAINAKLGSAGNAVVYTAPIEATPAGTQAASGVESLRALTADMKAGLVEALFILGGNPAYTAPADIEFAGQLKKFSEEKFPEGGTRRFSARLGLYDDETATLCQWSVPEAHFLEAWGDSRAYDGTASIVQPLIAPLYGGLSAIEFIALVTLLPGVTQDVSGYDIARETWRKQNLTTNFEKDWQKWVHDGVIPGTAFPAKSVTLKDTAIAALPAPNAPTPSAQSLAVFFRPDPTIWDGSFANSGWMQELAKPQTKITWDNVALVSPKTAEQLGVTSQDQVELTYNGRKVVAPLWVLPGQPENSVTLHLGYGRTRAGQVGTGVGFNAGALRTADALWHGSGLSLKKIGTYGISSTSHHFSIDVENNKIDSMHDREIILVGSIEKYRELKGRLTFETVKESAQHSEGKPEKAAPKEEAVSMYDGAAENEHKYEGYAAYHWGMSIDLNTCIGCNACAIACQAENNTPVVGKQQVSKGREMHWIRIERYYEGNDLENPNTYFQPVPCMHCENAPCEPVCPVAATVHSQEGLNQMVYNRCVGTRYCSNNCPYKVRRFNFLNYANDFSVPVHNLVNNPNVTVRGRGVMEKCSYCVQRINAKRIEAKKDGRELGGDEVVTACQQACPTQAIIFGNQADPKSTVAKLKKQEHNYSLLEELNTRPRTTYLAKLRNPNPEIG